MNHPLPNKIFVTGTGTDVGKTVVSAILVAGMKAQYWKPVQCGLDELTDTQWVQQHTNLPESHFLPETYRLKHPLSPHAAAELEDVEILMDAFCLPEIEPEDSLIIEGAGGIMVPLNAHNMVLDLIVALKIPVLLVSSNILGTINHTLLSLEQLRRTGIEVLGVVLNGDSNTINRQAIEQYGNTSVLAEIPHLNNMHSDRLEELFYINFQYRG